MTTEDFHRLAQAETEAAHRLRQLRTVDRRIVVVFAIAIAVFAFLAIRTDRIAAKTQHNTSHSERNTVLIARNTYRLCTLIVRNTAAINSVYASEHRTVRLTAPHCGPPPP